MITKEYAKIQSWTEIDPIAAAQIFQDQIEENIQTREAILAEYTHRELVFWADRTYDDVRQLADFLIENAGAECQEWTNKKTGEDCISVGIPTTSLGTFRLTRFSLDGKNEYEIYIEDENLQVAQSKLPKKHDDQTIDCVANIESVADGNFTPYDVAELEWGFELLMTIALDALPTTDERT